MRVSLLLISISWEGSLSAISITAKFELFSDRYDHYMMIGLFEWGRVLIALRPGSG